MVIFKMPEMALKPKSSLQIISCHNPAQPADAFVSLFFPLPEISFLSSNFGKHQKLSLGGWGGEHQSSAFGFQEAVCSHFRSINLLFFFSMHLFMWRVFTICVVVVYMSDSTLNWNFVAGLENGLFFCSTLVLHPDLSVFINEIKHLE